MKFSDKNQSNADFVQFDSFVDKQRQMPADIELNQEFLDKNQKAVMMEDEVISKVSAYGKTRAFKKDG